MINEYFFESTEAMLAQLLAQCVKQVSAAVAEKGTATLLLSGGSTPKALYQQLSKEDLCWEQGPVALVDERWVDVDQAGSNEAFIRTNLLINQAQSAKFIAMKSPAETAKKGEAEIEQRYQALVPPFDLTILGMGNDGHTASLFPYADGLDEALSGDSNKLCAAINATASEVTGELTERMSLSLSGLLQSKALCLLITGEEKRRVYQQALENKDQSLMPISAVLQQDNVPVNVFWAP